MTVQRGPQVGPLLFFVFGLALAVYFVFAAIQGDYGLFRRIEVNAQADQLQRQLDQLQGQVAQLENLTHRLSDDYLDLDLLDEQARKTLGLVRADEVVVQ